MASMGRVIVVNLNYRLGRYHFRFLSLRHSLSINKNTNPKKNASKYSPTLKTGAILDFGCPSFRPSVIFSFPLNILRTN